MERLTAVTSIVAATIVTIAIITFSHEPSQAPAEACAFEQTWYQGDIHFSQELVFDPSGTGIWTTSGMDSDAPHMRIAFDWHRTSATLTARVGRKSRTVGYEIERRGTLCLLTFDDVFLDDGQSRHYSNSP